MGRWLGIDYGVKRIGVAVGSTDDAITSPVKTIIVSDLRASIEQIASLVRDFQVEGIVVGLPLNMDGTAGRQAAAVEDVALQLAAKTRLDVRMWDERLSSFAADKALAGTLTRKKRRARQDAVAAATILKDFLTGGGPQCAPRPRRDESQ